MMTDDVKQTLPALGLAFVGLTLTAVVAIVMFSNGTRDAKDVVAVAGVFTSITGTLVGTFLGVHVGSAGKAALQSEMATLKQERDRITGIKEQAIASVPDLQRQQELRAM